MERNLRLDLTVVVNHWLTHSVNLWLTTAMDEIAKAQRAVDRAREQLTATVREARSNGRTWAEIGDELGMSRQAAFKRFGEVTNPANGQKITGGSMTVAQIQQFTEKVFDHIGAGELDELEQLIHPDARKELSQEVIAETWAKVLSEIGGKESYEDTHVVVPAGDRIEDGDSVLGTVVGVTTVNCEAGEVMGRVAVDEKQRIVGLLIVPTDHSPLPF
ncbi:hypothetical protein [Dietzia timorensis]|uniref:hypothetical protein n=1 Tax=Dietzia timorensis TaxID=499555 RepID=UPI0018D3C368|nr:hypothetical protein [Dietzia timorensis]